MKKTAFLLIAMILLAGESFSQTSTPTSSFPAAGGLNGNEIIGIQRLVSGKYTWYKTNLQEIANLGAGVPISRTLTINGVTYDLSVNRTWTVTSPTDTNGFNLATKPFVLAQINAIPSPTWTTVTGKPSSFPPSAHTHVVGDINASGSPSSTTYLRGDGTWATPPSSGGGGGTWGSITGTLSSQTDLASALSGKQATLASGSNIKTVNGSSLVGSGNVAILGSDSISTNGTVAPQDTGSWPSTRSALALWGRVQDAIAASGGGSGLPSQSGQSGKFLTTNGSAASWATVSGSSGVTSFGGVTGAVTLGTGLSMTGNVLNATGGGGGGGSLPTTSTILKGDNAGGAVASGWTLTSDFFNPASSGTLADGVDYSITGLNMFRSVSGGFLRIRPADVSDLVLAGQNSVGNVKLLGSNISLSTLAGSGSRITMADASGTVSATLPYTVNQIFQGSNNRIGNSYYLQSNSGTGDYTDVTLNSYRHTGAKFLLDNVAGYMDVEGSSGVRFSTGTTDSYDMAITVNGAIQYISCPSYTNDAGADADANLPSGGLYKLTTGRGIFIKP